MRTSGAQTQAHLWKQPLQERLETIITPYIETLCDICVCVPVAQVA